MSLKTGFIILNQSGLPFAASPVPFFFSSIFFQRRNFFPPFFCSHFEELQTVLFEVELIINNAPLTYVYPNTIKTCLTLIHLLFGRQLSYSSNTTSTVVMNLNVLSSATDKINRISNHFWDRWRHEYEVNLRETQRTSKLNINSPKVNVNDTGLVYDEKVHIHFWGITIVTGVLPSRDSEIKGAIVIIANTNTILKCLVNKLFTAGNTYKDNNQTDEAREQKLRREATVIAEQKRKYNC